MNGAGLRGLVQACHPAPTLAVTVLSAVLFVSAGNHAATCAVGTLAVLAGQLSIGWSNDLIDRDRDRQVGRAGKPLVSGPLPVATLRAAVLGAVLATLPLSLALGWPAGLLHLAAVGAGWSYNLRLKSTVLSALPYLFAFAALPVIATLARHRQWPAWWVVVAAGLVGVAAHFANVLPDLNADQQTGVRGLPQRVGYRPSLAAATVLISLVALLILLARTGGAAAAGFGAVLVLVGVATRARAEPAFVVVMLAAAVDVAVLVGTGGLG